MNTNSCFFIFTKTIKTLVICICPNVAAFFMFLLGIAASRRLFFGIRARAVMPQHKQNLNEWRRMGSQSQQHFQVFSLFFCLFDDTSLHKRSVFLSLISNNNYNNEQLNHAEPNLMFLCQPNTLLFKLLVDCSCCFP